MKECKIFVKKLLLKGYQLWASTIFSQNKFKSLD